MLLYEDFSLKAADVLQFVSLKCYSLSSPNTSKMADVFFTLSFLVSASSASKADQNKFVSGPRMGEKIFTLSVGKTFFYIYIRTSNYYSSEYFEIFEIKLDWGGGGGGGIKVYK